jgi:acetylornithine deacetylase/succinyl-diaminopimelate desuccinylase-like protein
MTGLSRNARRRLALYGGAVAFIVLVIGLSRLLSRAGPRTSVRDVFGEADRAMAHEAVPLLTEYVRIDTSNPPGDTRKGAAFLAHAFECENIPYEITGDPRRPVFVARLQGRSREGALLLLSHMDVVPPGDLSSWRKPPFSAVRGDAEERFYLYGRGTLDMKGQAIAYLLAMAKIKRAGIVPERDIVFLAESGEETFDPTIGVGWVLAHRPDILEGVHEVFNEGGVNEVLTANVERYGIEVLQKAFVAVYVNAPGKEALERFRTFLREKDAELPIRIDPTVREFMRFIAPSRSDVWGRLMLGGREAVLSKKFLDEVPEVYRSLLKDVIYAGGVEPDSAGGFTMRVVRTLLPGSSVKAQYEELKGWAREHGLKVRIQFLTDDATPTEAKGRAWEILDRVLGLDPERAPVGIYILNGSYTTSAYLRPRGFRVYGVSPFTLNIVEAAKIHNPNERISLPTYLDGVQRMERIVREFATAP